MHKKRHPELEGYPPGQPLYTFELKSRKKTIQNRLLWIFVGLLMGMGLAAGAYMLRKPVSNWWPLESQPENLAADDPFRQASNQAMSAAELTQTAEFQEDWSQVALLWQQAIKNMQAVQPSHPNHAIAQKKIAEYDRNLKYAQSNVNTRQAINPNNLSYWTVGSDRDLVVSVQGMPERIIQYDASCKEVLYFGDSFVELVNGYVTEYSDLDGNLKILADEKIVLSIRSGEGTWSLGSSKEEVFRTQGTPTRTNTYQNSMTLHYDDSFIEVEDNRVVGYANFGENLKVGAVPVAFQNEASSLSIWGIGATRTEVLRAEQRTPTSVSRQDKSCEETFHFDNSTVTFRKGLVAEYSNSSQNLKFQ